MPCLLTTSVELVKGFYQSNLSAHSITAMIPLGEHYRPHPVAFLEPFLQFGKASGSTSNHTLQHLPSSLIWPLQKTSVSRERYDNAFAETFFHSMKAELEVSMFENKLKAKAQVEEYIEWYNAERLHSSLDYMSPIEYENYIAVA